MSLKSGFRRFCLLDDKSIGVVSCLVLCNSVCAAEFLSTSPSLSLSLSFLCVCNVFCER